MDHEIDRPQAIVDCSAPRPVLIPLNGRTVEEMERQFEQNHRERQAQLARDYAKQLHEQALAADAAERTAEVQRAQLEQLKHRVHAYAARPESDEIVLALCELLGILPPQGHGVSHDHDAGGGHADHGR